LTGKLTIGVLESMRIDDVLPPLINIFLAEYPEVEVDLSYLSMPSLITKLYEGNLDVSFSPQHEVKNRTYLEHKIIADSRCCLVMHESNHLAEKDFISFAELENETFIILKPNIEEIGHTIIFDEFKKHGFRPNIVYSPSFFSSFLYVQAAFGITMFDTRSIFRNAPGIRFIDTEQIGNPSFTAAWHVDNTNDAFLMFKKTLQPF
jgi:DNA-binding transcriptional LysR family regulator